LPRSAIALPRGRSYDGRFCRERTLETVYIVDDDATFARSIARLVGAAGWNARVYASAHDFLAADCGEHPACVLLDVRMPGMHGPDLYRAMIERHMDLPVIFLTAHGGEAAKADAMSLGALDFLEKPVHSEVLLARIRTALARDAQSGAAGVADPGDVGG
jgi:FixJ family two-component response regulator